MAEAKRLLGVLETWLKGREWIMAHTYTIANIACFPRVRSLDMAYEAGPLVGLSDFPNVID